MKESDEKYHSLLNDVFDTSATGLFILDSDFKVVWINRAIEEYFGLKKEDVIGKNKRQLIQSKIKNIFEDPATFKKKVFSTYDNNTYIESFECHVLPEGERIDCWFEHWSQPITFGLYKGGRVEHYTNITARKKAEEEIRKSEERYRTLFMNNPVETIIVGVEGKIVAFNKTKKESSNRLPEIGSQMYVDYASKHKIDMRSELLNCIESDKIKRFPDLEYGDGKTSLNITIAPYSDGAIITSEDITARKKAEDVLKKRMNELEIFNDASVDRELIINELRKEINELLNKLDKEPKYKIVE